MGDPEHPVPRQDASQPVRADEVPPPPAGALGPVPPPEPGHATGPGRKLLIIGLAVLLLAGAIVGIAIAGGGGGSPRGAPEPVEPDTPGTPVGLSASTDVKPFGVALWWTAPPGSATIQGYKIFRDQTQIAAVPTGTTTYTDTNVVPGESFTYQVLTRGEGLLESERASTQATVPVPSVKAARVEGTFNVKVKALSQHGFQQTLGRFTMGWRFTPKCDQGACKVTWKDLSEKTLKATLRRNAAKYSGSDSGRFLGSCGSSRTTGTVTISFHVTKAKAIGSEWRASKLVGTVTDSIPSQLGCVSAGATLSIVATLL